MPEVLGPPRCSCRQLPHRKDCAVAPFFDKSDAITLDSEQGDYHDDAPFILQCPRGCRFLQFEHALHYDYTPVHGQTEQTELPLVCPKCGWSDKQSLPAIVGFDPNDDVEDEHFKIICPNTSCLSEYTREDGNIQIWLEKAILMGVDEARIGITTFYRGQTVNEWTELSIECYNCGYQCGETED